jgi:hypothetical protein
MHVNRGLLGWGVFFITCGCVPLAVRAGYLDSSVLARAWELWPLILVGIGLGLILRRTKAAVVGGLVVAVTLGLMAGSLVAGGIPSTGWTSACGFVTHSGNGTAFPDQAGSFGLEARVDLELNCGEVAVSSADGTAWTATGISVGGRPPEILASGDRLTIRSAAQNGINAGGSGPRWDVTLPRQVSLALGMSVNAGSGRMALGAMRVPEMIVSVNAGDATVDAVGLVESGSLSATVNAGSLAISLPVPTTTLRGSLSVNAGAIDVCVPDGVGLRIRTGREALSSDNFSDRGLVRTGDTWTRPGFATAAQRIELETDANLARITLNPEDGCG